MAPKVLALDLERTLIDDAMSGRPRPGLFDFLTFCHQHFERVALFTSVETEDAREVLEHLGEQGHIPAEFLARLEFVEWSGEHKDLGFVAHSAPEDVLLLDDDAGWVRPDQRHRWIPVVPWDGGPDAELRRVQEVLEVIIQG